MAAPVLTTDECNAVIAFLSNLDSFKYEARDRCQFVQNAGLGKFDIQWSGRADVVASTLVNLLNMKWLNKESMRKSPPTLSL